MVDEIFPAQEPRELDEHFLRRHLKLRQLVILDAVFEERSLTRAAEVLSLTQPAVSKVVQTLEQTLGVALLERTSRGVVPTAYGQTVRTRIKAIFNEVRQLGDELSALGGASSGHVITGTMISAAAWLLPQAIVHLKAHSPAVVVSVHEGGIEELMPRLSAGELDIIVGRIPSDIHQGVHHEPLYTEPLVAVGRPGHPAGTVEELAMDELADYPWIVPTRQGPVRAAVEKMFMEASLPLPRNRVHSLSILTNIQILRASDMICLMPRLAAEHYVRQGSLEILPLQVSEPLGEVGFSLPTGRDPTPATRAFIRSLRAVVRGKPRRVMQPLVE